MNSKIKITFLFCVLGVMAGCKNDTTPVGPTPTNTGAANFTRYVSLGNSLTAGFQSGALSERDQVYSYPNLIAGQIYLPDPPLAVSSFHKSTGKLDFEQPLIKNPGIGNRLRLVDLTPTIVAETGVDPTDPASNLNVLLPRPYNNLGIPGAILVDMIDTTGASSDFVSKSIARGNPFFAQILRSHLFGNSILAQAKALFPTFVTLWIGNNDVLGYATSGGTRGTNFGLSAPPGTLPTEPFLFNFWYRYVVDSLVATGAGIVVGNIPDVTTIPFFTTLGPLIHSKLPPGIYFRYQRNGNNGPSNPVADTTTLGGASTDPLITLSGSAYAPLIGHPTGQWYRDNGISPLPSGIDTTKPFALHPQNPWPDALTLDTGEQTTAQNAVTTFNVIIDSIASNRGIGVMNANALLHKLQSQGIYVPDLGTFSAQFILGGAFSYDGIHPSSRGEAIVANEYIKVINQKFQASIPYINLASVPGIPIGKASVLNASAENATYPEWKSLIDLMNGGSH